jgi:multisubunit Na+/H+ antiporter MnhB subunit
MSGDPSAWIPLVFWAQALLLVAIGVVWLRNRWGRWQTWVVSVPVLGFVGLGVAQQVAILLPNLM